MRAVNSHDDGDIIPWEFHDAVDEGICISIIRVYFEDPAWRHIVSTKADSPLKYRLERISQEAVKAVNDIFKTVNKRLGINISKEEKIDKVKDCLTKLKAEGLFEKDNLFARTFLKEYERSANSIFSLLQ